MQKLAVEVLVNGNQKKWSQKFCIIVHFTIVYKSKAGGDLVLIEPSLFFLCKCGPVSLRIT